MKTMLVFLILPSILMAASFTDDFDGYSPGEDLGDSIYWLRLDTGGNLVAADDGGNGIVETVWGSRKYLAYACLGGLVCSDGVIRSDIKFNGAGAIVGLLARMNPVTGDCYIGGIYRLYGSIGATVIAYVNATGDFTILTNDFFYPLNEDTWYDVAFEVTGSSPAILKVSVNGTVNSNIQDNTYDLAIGAAGLGGNFETAAPMFYLDNFCITDYNQATANTTFGRIKSIFSE